MFYTNLLILAYFSIKLQGLEQNFWYVDKNDTFV